MQRDVLLHRSCRIHGLNWRMADFTFVHAQGTSYFCRELPSHPGGNHMFVDRRRREQTATR